MKLCFILLQILQFQFQEGDILFQDCDCGPICDAIEDVTVRPTARRYSHIGIVHKVNGSFRVIEANTGGVVSVPMDSFIHRYHDANGQPTISIGRFKARKDRQRIPSALNFIKNQLGTKYDTVFLLNNDVYYCSELIYDGFKAANKGKEVFKLYPMTFRLPNSDITHPEFARYYQSIGQPVPESMPGLNPTSISIDPRLKITHLYSPIR